MAVNTDIFLGSGASLTFVPEVDLQIVLDSSSTTTNLVCDATWTDNVRMVQNLYVGCVLDLYNASGSITVPVSSHVITANSETAFTISPAAVLADLDGAFQDATDFAVIRSYGAPSPTQKTGSIARLNADNWLGLVESASFPNVEQEMKQMNIQLGGSRNFTHQYKGIRTASGGNINVVANHATWLYYALGQCTTVNATFTGSTSTDPTDNYSAHTNNVHYLDIGATAGTKSFSDNLTAHTSTGPIFYRTATDSAFLLPPVLTSDGTDKLNMALLTLPEYNASGVLTNPIQYTFAELNTEDLPSFALEQTLSKLESTNTYNTETDSASESHNFVRIARGNRVNTLTMTANENEEVKFTMDLNTRAVNKLKQAEAYQARGGNSSLTATTLFNFGSGANTLAATGEESLEPFFFSTGSFSIFGQTFLKITNMTLTINNNLQDKRFVGIGNKDVKSGIPAQRTYELTFTAMVTDDKLFEELFTETEVASGTSTIDLQFDKLAPNGTVNEQIIIKLKDYFLSSSNVTIPDDKGPITIEATVMPRQLDTCTVKTHWILQG